MASDDSIVLKLEDVHKQYESADRDPVPVLRGISLIVQRGDSLAIVGPSGSGKSTLLNILGSLDSPTRGSIRLDGEELAHLPEQRLAAIRSQKIGFIFQSHHLLPQCSVLENILVPALAATGRAPASAVERAKQLLERVGLGHRLTHQPAQLSGGECQRVAVVRALINRPSLILADEPTGALDHSTAESLADLLVELNRDEHVTLVVVTHSEELAAKMGTTHQLQDGQFAASAN
ncbi:MAG: ATP-binding protein [Verrucomicrobiales bacterium]|jgi:lipoprotein-releasing system ATP-binding protein|nr:ATP-binding protein [Verrucomicrobiales bacterium]MEC7811652.1 ABC transporter ATP-binding protein [Verrucomicrobiota bacterium]